MPGVPALAVTSMDIDIRSVADLGLAVRASRREAGVRLDDLASLAGVSKQFVSDTEHGKPTIQLGLVFKLLEELGLRLKLDLPAAAVTELEALRAKGGLKPPRARGAVRATTTEEG